MSLIDPIGQAMRYVDDGRDKTETATTFGVDVDQLSDAIADRANGTPGRSPAPSDTHPDQALGQRDTWDTPPDEAPPDDSRPDPLAGVRDGSWLRAQQFPPLRYAVPGLVPEGFTLLIGPPKAGKSWLLLGMLLSVAAGGRALGKLATGPARRVLYLALEDGDRRMQDRCGQLLGHTRDIPDAFTYATTAPPGAAGALITAYLDRHPDTALVVVDTLGRVMPPAAQGESAYQRDYRIGASLKRLADQRPGLAVVVAHHDRKAGSEDFVDAVSGTHGLAGAADTIIVLERKRQASDGLLRITGRDVVEETYALQVRDGTWTLDGADLAAAAATARRRVDLGALGDRSAEILTFVAEHPGGIDAATVEEKFGDGARRYLTRMVETGRLVRLKRGTYALPPPSVPSVPMSQTTCQDCGWPVESVQHDATCLGESS